MLLTMIVEPGAMDLVMVSSVQFANLALLTTYTLDTDSGYCRMLGKPAYVCRYVNKENMIFRMDSAPREEEPAPDKSKRWFSMFADSFQLSFLMSN